MAGGRLWTDDEWATLRGLAETGAGQRDMMLALNRGRGAITRALRKAGLRVDPERAEQRRIEAMRARRGIKRKSPPPETPEAKRKRLEGLRKFYASEAGLAERARRSNFMREYRKQPEMLELAVKAGKASGEKRMSWCPPHLRDTYRTLAHGGKGYTAAEAKALLMPEIERFKQTHEGRLWMLQSGKGKLVRAFKPTVQHDRSLIGSTLA